MFFIRSHEHAHLTSHFSIFSVRIVYLSLPLRTPTSSHPNGNVCTRVSAVRARSAAAVARGGRRRRRRRAVVQRTRVRAQKLRGVGVLRDRERQRLMIFGGWMRREWLGEWVDGAEWMAGHWHVALWRPFQWGDAVDTHAPCLAP
jgi:hypothetical protein